MNVSNIFTEKRFDWNKVSFTVPEALQSKDTPVFQLTVPISKTWDSKEKKLLIICEHIDTKDLKAKALCDEFFGGVLSNLLANAIQYANLTVDCGKISEYGIAVVPFQSFKTYHLDPRRQTIADKHFAQRTEKLLEKLQPTHVIVFGDNAAKYMLHLEDLKYKRGWTHKYTRDWGDFVAVSTVDPADLIAIQGDFDPDDDYEDEDEEEGGRDLFSKTNLLGQVFRDMSSVFSYGHTKDEHGLQFSIAGVSGKPILINTLKKVDKLFDLLEASQHFAYDTETKDLNKIANKLLVMQFAMDTERAFVLPYLHRQSPFTAEEREHIRYRMTKLLCNPKIDPFGDRYIIGTNLQFDLTQTREQLDIPIVTWPLFDIQYGDFVFDENMAELDIFAGNDAKAWSMMAISTRFGSTLLLEKEGFSKQDRDNMEASDLTDQDTLDYMGWDCTVPMAIHYEQIKRAKATGYKKFMKMVYGQSSNNEHVASVMEQVGVHIDTPYLKKQMKKGSDLHSILDDAKQQLYETEYAQQANEILAESRGVDLEEGGLFDDDDSVEDSRVQIFNIDKPEHRQVLFADVMGLEPVSGWGKGERKNGKGVMTLDKLWQHEHREVHEVSLYTRCNKVAKLISSYISSFYEKVTESDDGKIDGRLRPSFGFLYVKTGRGNSFKPSLQQTPTRSKEAKYVKRMFSTPYGRLKLKTDFSANEVRFAGVLSEDEVMCGPFNVARSLKKKMFNLSVELADIVIKQAQVKSGSAKHVALEINRKEVSEELDKVRAELKTKGDIHIQNVFRFFGKWVAKNDPLRDAIKAVVFGVIYGKGAGTLGRDMWNQKVSELRDKVFTLKKQIREAEVVEEAEA